MDEQLQNLSYPEVPKAHCQQDFWDSNCYFSREHIEREDIYADLKSTHWNVSQGPLFEQGHDCRGLMHMHRPPVPGASSESQGRCQASGPLQSASKWSLFQVISSARGWGIGTVSACPEFHLLEGKTNSRGESLQVGGETPLTSSVLAFKEVAPRATFWADLKH